jgi:hypothetical protein
MFSELKFCDNFDKPVHITSLAIKELRGGSRKEAFDLYNHIDLKELKEAYPACIHGRGYDQALNLFKVYRILTCLPSTFRQP